MNKLEISKPDLEYTTPKSEKESLPIQLELVESPAIIQEQLPTHESLEKTTDEFRKIEEIRSQIQEIAPTSPSQQEELVSQNPTEIEVIKDKEYYIEYVPKENIYPAYGYGGGNRAVVRQDLPPRVKKFVKAHELYHCQDEATWGGWIGKEIRANIVPGLKDPIGLAATVWETITDVDRIKFYLKRIKEGY